LIVEEEEHLVPGSVEVLPEWEDDRPSDAAASNDISISRYFHIVEIVEVVVGVQILIPKIGV
jgi:hypothetical protein